MAPEQQPTKTCLNVGLEDEMVQYFYCLNNLNPGLNVK